MSESKVVITYGTFDLFHIGHLNLLQRCRELGDQLIVGVSTDDFNERKGKTTVVPYNERAQIVSAIKYVDHVFSEEDWGQKEADIRRFGASVFVMGDDWAGKFDFVKEWCDVVYLTRTPGISSSSIKHALAILQEVGRSRC